MSPSHTHTTHTHTHRLKYLNLDNNELYVVPQLRLIGTSPLKSAANSKRQATPHTRATPRHRMTTPKSTRVSSERGVASQGFRMSDTLSTASPKQEDIEIVDSSHHGPEVSDETSHVHAQLLYSNQFTFPAVITPHKMTDNGTCIYMYIGLSRLYLSVSDQY